MPLIWKLLRYFFGGVAQRRVGAQALVLCVLLGLIWSGWRTFKKEICSQESYIVREENIRVWNPPKWIPDSFVSEALQLRASERRKEPLNAVDPRLVDSLVAAFASHPCVEKVEGVAVVGRPARVELKLKFKTPVAVVDPTPANVVESSDDASLDPLADFDSLGGAPGTSGTPANRRTAEKYVVGGSGYRLPDAYFRARPTERNEEFVCILGIPSTPVSEYGPCGDPLVVEAAGFAEFLQRRGARQELKIDRIVATKKPGETKGQYFLKTENGTTVRWGYFVPSKEGNAETTTDAQKQKEALFAFQGRKWERLLELVDRYKTLDDVPREAVDELDLSNLLSDEDVGRRAANETTPPNAESDK